MFEKIKQLAKIKEIKDSLAKEEVEIEKMGVKIILNGEIEVKEIFLNSDLKKEEQEKILKECINEGIKKIQKELAVKFSKIPDLGI